MEVYNKIQNNELNFPADELVTNSSRYLTYIFVANNAFPLRSDIMKPFRQADSTYPKKKKYSTIPFYEQVEL